MVEIKTKKNGAALNGVKFAFEETTPEQLYTELQGLLLKGVVVFDYLNKDGALRRAVGTLKPELIAPKEAKFVPALLSAFKTLCTMMEQLASGHGITPETVEEAQDAVNTFKPQIFPAAKASKGGGKTTGSEYQTYWDFEKAAFRVFHRDNVVTIY